MIVLILYLIFGTLLIFILKFYSFPVSLDLGFIAFSGIPLLYIIVGSLRTYPVLRNLLSKLRFFLSDTK